MSVAPQSFRRRLFLTLENLKINNLGLFLIKNFDQKYTYLALAFFKHQGLGLHFVQYFGFLLVQLASREAIPYLILIIELELWFVLFNLLEFFILLCFLESDFI